MWARGKLGGTFSLHSWPGVSIVYRNQKGEDVKTKQFPHGTAVKIARELGVSRQRMCDILGRRRTVSRERAETLATICTTMGFDVPWWDWYNNEATDNPLFTGRPDLTRDKFPHSRGAIVQSDLLA